MPVFNKLRKGEKRSLGNLRSPRLSTDAGAFSNTGDPAEQNHPTVVRAPNDLNYEAATAEDQELLHIRLRDEAARRANAARSGNNYDAYDNNPYGSLPNSPTAPSLYDGHSVYTSGGERAAGGNHRRSASTGAASTNTTANANAGWYMTTGVLPATIAGTDDSASRNRKYTSIYRATGLSSSPPQQSYMQNTRSLSPNAGSSSLSSSPPSSSPIGAAAANTKMFNRTQDDALSRNVSTKTAKTGYSTATSGSNYSQYTQKTSSVISPNTAAGSLQQRNSLSSSPPSGDGFSNRRSIAAHPPVAARPQLSTVESGREAAPSRTYPSSPQQQQSPRSPTISAPIAAVPIAASHPKHAPRKAAGLPEQALSTSPQQRGSFTTAPTSGAMMNQAPPALPPVPRGEPLAFQWRDDNEGNTPQQPQSRFTEQMDMVGRKSEDAPTAFGRDRDVSALSASRPTDRGDTLTASQIQNQRDQATERGEIGSQRAPALPAEREEDLTASQIQAQRRLQGDNEAQATPPARNNNIPLYSEDVDPAEGYETAEEPDTSPVATPSAGIPTPFVERSSILPIVASRGGHPKQSSIAEEGGDGIRSRDFKDQPRQQLSSADPAVLPRSVPQQRTQPSTVTTQTPTYGPSMETTRTSAPQVLSSKTSRYIDTPTPSIPYAAPAHPQHSSLFSNVTQKIPHYMFVKYEAEVCQECIDSDQRMHALQHGGEKWRYNYADPAEERELPSEDPNTAKTGRKEYTDNVSLLPTTSAVQGNNGQPCQCESCLKNRDLVRHAAENGLIEEIFGGVRHPKSETIETITYTTIVRAPIIEETVTTVWCEEPNCPECLAKDEEYRQNEYRNLVDGLPGMVLHQTEDSGKYDGKDIWGLNGAVGDDSIEGESSGEGRSIGKLLERAGNPEVEKLRGSENRSQGEEIGGDSSLVQYNCQDHSEGSETCPVCEHGILAHKGVAGIFH